MKLRFSLILALVCAAVAAAMPFPGVDPGQAGASAKDGVLRLGNNVVDAQWQIDEEGIRLVALQDRRARVVYPVAKPAFSLGEGLSVGVPVVRDLAPVPASPVEAERLPGKMITAPCRIAKLNLDVQWRAILRDGSHYIRQEVVLTPSADDVSLGRLTMLDLNLPGAAVAGSVRGSPVVTDTLFLGVEHPASLSRVSSGGLAWAPADFAKGNEAQVLKYDVSSAVKAAGRYEIVFQYTSGNHRLDVEGVKLRVGGKTIATDEHPGITGDFNRSNVYVLAVAEALAGAVALEVRARVDSVNAPVNSSGEIRILRDGKPVGAADTRVECSFSRAVSLPKGQPFVMSSVIGVAPSGQVRRAFQCYLDRERAHAYRPFLHYNSWYHLNIDRPGNRMSEAEALKAIADVGTEMTTKRGVKLASYVMDDGWDSHERVWDFNENFPGGFSNVAKAAGGFGSGVGVWMSPWGGYGGPKDARVKNGRSRGFEVNGAGLSMAGPNYRAHFLETGLRMIRDYRLNFFKFDGMGGGNFTDGGDSAFANDMDAIFGVCRELRQANPDVYISATVGTWPSPFWLRFADSIWRQGEDTAFAGVGSGRERWITYRDATVHDRIVKRGPLYPIHSLMVHGIVIGERGNPSRMERDEASVRHEARSYFGTGTGLQELYVSPHLLSAPMWDAIAESARWADAHRDVLVDSHWVGGSPGALEVYGFASWMPGKGVLTLRNPSDKPQSFALDPAAVFDLPNGAPRSWTLASPYRDQRVQRLDLSAGPPVSIALEPFEVLVFDAAPAR